jgi:hypothetical protein
LGVVGNFGVKAGKVKAIKDIVLLNLAKVLISLRGKEPRYPLS